MGTLADDENEMLAELSELKELATKEKAEFEMIGESTVDSTDYENNNMVAEHYEYQQGSSGLLTTNNNYESDLSFETARENTFDTLLSAPNSAIRRTITKEPSPSFHKNNKSDFILQQQLQHQLSSSTQHQQQNNIPSVKEECDEGEEGVEITDTTLDFYSPSAAFYPSENNASSGKEDGNDHHHLPPKTLLFESTNNKREESPPEKNRRKKFNTISSAEVDGAEEIEINLVKSLSGTEAEADADQELQKDISTHQSPTYSTNAPSSPVVLDNLTIEQSGSDGAIDIVITPKNTPTTFLSSSSSKKKTFEFKEKEITTEENLSKKNLEENNISESKQKKMTFSSSNSVETKSEVNAQLLALLEGIPSKPSKRTDRSKDNNKMKSKTTTEDSLPPWKRKNKMTKPSSSSSSNIEIMVATSASSPPSSSSPVRNNENDGSEINVSPSKREDDTLPPWKRKVNNNMKKKKSFEDIEITIVASSPEDKVLVSKDKLAEPLPLSDNKSSSVTDDAGTSGGGGFKSDLPKTFNGDRGGDAVDPELLALLKGVSSKSSSSDRFSSNDDNDENDTNEDNVAPEAKIDSISELSSITTEVNTEKPVSLPPWKRKNKQRSPTKASSIDVEISVAAPKTKTIGSIPSESSAAVEPLPPSSPSKAEPMNEPMNSNSGGGFKSDLPKTFNGDRGGDAVDPELLAMLRGVSSKSSSSDRFNNENDTNEVSEVSVEKTQSIPEPSPISTEVDTEIPESLPPWKRKNKQRSPTKASSIDVEISVAAPKTNTNGSIPAESSVAVEPLPPSPPPKAEPMNEPMNSNSGGGFKSDLPKTFNGDRGGDAVDPELLAMLRGVSSKSSSSDRFDSNDDNVDENKADQSEPKEDMIPEAKIDSISELSSITTEVNTEKPESLPPWKRKTKQRSLTKASSVDVEISVAAPKTKTDFSVPTESSVSVKSLPSPPPKAGPMDEPMNSNSGGGGFKSDLPKTFNGDRGGDAVDPELLALLKGVSSKSSSSDRFSSNDNNDDENKSDQSEPKEDRIPVVKTQSISQPSPISAQESTHEPESLPPWKRKIKKRSPTKASSVDVEISVAAPKTKTEISIPSESSAAVEPLPPSPPSPTSTPPKVEPMNEPMNSNSGGGGFKSDLPKTFNGDRGGDAVDPELLAMLRGVSSKSSSSDRFSSNDDNDDENKSEPKEETSLAAKTQPIPEPSPISAQESTQKPVSLPPWKRKTKKRSSNKPSSGDIEISVAAPKPKTDVSIPAESSVAVESLPSPPPKAAYVNEPIDSNSGGGFQSDLPKTFNGDRGGDAVDPELLALLRGVSSKSSSSERFDSINNNDDENKSDHSKPKEVMIPTEVTQSTTEAEVNTEKPVSLPPWKRKIKKRSPTKASSVDVEISVAAPNTKTNGSIPSEPSVAVEPSPPSPTSPPPKAGPMDEPINSNSGGGGFKSDLPKTFNGDRGGDAVDPELLAMLRGVSSKSSSSDRFRNDDENGESETKTLPIESEQPSLSNAPTSGEPLPPRNRQAKQRAVSKPKTQVSIPSESSETVESSPSLADRGINDAIGMKGGIKSDLPKTFKGDRGGDAADEELLALLRGVSSKSSSSDRFNSTSENSESAPEASPIGSAEPSAVAATPSISSNSFPGPSAAPPPSTPPNPISENLSLDEIPNALCSKTWSVRKTAYLSLSKILNDLLKENGKESVESNSVIENLDSFVVEMVNDSNAAALDSALEFVLLYAYYCSGATFPDQARKVTSSLIKGSALSSSRPSTTKLSKALLLKLMEVCESGPESIHAIVEVLLKDGIASRKPKVVMACSSLVVDAAESFGAMCLPLAAVSSGVPKMLANSNSKVRESSIQIIAEVCRESGSKDKMKKVIDNLKPAQQSQLDKLLEKQPTASVPTIGLRCMSHEELKSVMEEKAKEAMARQFESRPAVNIFDPLSRSEFDQKLKLAKWSEKVGALEILIKCGGEKPYKLAQPSSAVSYTELISTLKGLLSHTHFAVNSKAMEALSMLALGVGHRLYPNLRPLLPLLMSLSKDKKLTTAVAKCLDTFFGTVLSLENLLDKEGGVPCAVNEKKQKNALARTSVVEFITRCVERGETAGKYGVLKPGSVQGTAKLLSDKLSDTDAKVRKAALTGLTKLLSVDDSTVVDVVRKVVEQGKEKNARAYKTLSKLFHESSVEVTSIDSPGGISSTRKSSTPKRSVTPIRKATRSSSTSRPSSRSTSTPVKAPPKPSRPPASKKISQVSSTRPGSASSKKSSSSQHDDDNDNNDEIISLEESIELLESFSIPNWDATEDEGGILTGMKSTSWKVRKSALDSLNEFVMSLVSDNDTECDNFPTSALAVLVKEHTKGFKESNFNLMKAIIEFFVSLCEVHEYQKKALPSWICKAATSISVEKLSDRKLSGPSHDLLMALGVVRNPSTIIRSSLKTIATVKSPVTHEALLKWLVEFCKLFGAAAIGNCMNDLVVWISDECESSNPKVRQASLLLLGELHVQLGPVLKALAQSVIGSKCSSSTQSQIDSTFEKYPYDPDASTVNREKMCVVNGSSNNAESSTSSGSKQAVMIDLPKLDLVQNLPRDCIDNLGSKEGKASWKIRKAALEDVSSALDKNAGLLETSSSSLKSLVELLRALKPRLDDSQSNLKPLAANVIGSILGSVEKPIQAKLSKLVLSPIISAILTDNKKTMRDASMNALICATQISELEGGGVNNLSMEVLISPFVSEIEKSEYKASGLPDILNFVTERVEFLPKASSNSLSKLHSQQEQFAIQVVACLTSSKAETRSAAENLLRKCISVEALKTKNLDKGVEKLLPAQQRAIASLIDPLRESYGEKPKEKTREKEMKRTSSYNSKRRESSPMRRTNPAIDRTKSTRSRLKVSTSHRVLSTVGSRLKSPENCETPRSFLSSAPSSFDESDYDTENPLKPKNSNFLSKQERCSSAIRKRNNWPEYPEEPTSNVHFASLKKSWSQIIPNSAIETLFPPRGMNKQEDAIPGLTLMEKVLEMTFDLEDTIVIDQLDFIFKWFVCALCSREHTKGLHSLLNFIQKLFGYLMERGYEMNDMEASTLLPYLLEKASTAKGRFGELFNDIIGLITSDAKTPLYRLHSYGQYICVPLIDKSSTSKTRALAMRECRICIESAGLNAVGKKGMIIIAKSLSQESISENRSVALDVFEAVIKRMKGDIGKLIRVIGKNITPAAKQLVEDRWAKHGSIPGASSVGSGSTRSKNRTVAESAPRGPSSISIPTIPKPTKTSSNVQRESDFKDMIPPLNLNLDSRSDEVAAGENKFSSSMPQNPFTFTYRSEDSSTSKSIVNLSNIQAIEKQLRELPSSAHNTPSRNNNMNPRKSLSNTPVIDRSAAHQSEKSISQMTPNPQELKVSSTIDTSNTMTTPVAKISPSLSTTLTTVGAAASLRKRLQQIRDKHRNTPGKVVPTSNPATPVSNVDNKPAPTADSSKSKKALSSLKTLLGKTQSLSSPPRSPPTPKVHDDAISKQINEFLEAPSPLSDSHPIMLSGMDALRKLHAALSKNSSASSNFDVTEMKKIRNDVIDDTSYFVNLLSRVMNYAFGGTHSPGDQPFDISVHILSVTLAVAMAIFRDALLSTSVSERSLSGLIGEAATALLDPRLGDSSNLDGSTRSQLVKAINKLAIQAAISAKRQNAFHALLNLQLKYCTTSAKSINDEEKVSLNNRLSRVITKLFSRLIKLEDASDSPFSIVDMGALLRSSEKALCSCDEIRTQEGYTTLSSLITESDDTKSPMSACVSMLKLLVQSLLKANEDSGGLHQVRDILSCEGIDPVNSFIGKLLSSCVPEEDLQHVNTNTFTRKLTTGEINRKVASLVSEIGNASDDAQRNKALVVLSDFSSKHDIDIDSHLAHLSAPFRAFILQQIQSLKAEQEEQSAEEPNSLKTQAMSGRLKMLRAKLQNTEAAVQPVVLSNPESNIPPVSHVSRTLDYSTQVIQQSESNDAHETSSSSQPLSALRSRLAAAQKKRADRDKTIKNDDVLTKSKTSTSSMLKARLDAVKRNKRNG